MAYKPENLKKTCQKLRNINPPPSSDSSESDSPIKINNNQRKTNNSKRRPYHPKKVRRFPHN